MTSTIVKLFPSPGVSTKGDRSRLIRSPSSFSGGEKKRGTNFPAVGMSKLYDPQNTERSVVGPTGTPTATREVNKEIETDWSVARRVTTMTAKLGILMMVRQR